MKDEICRDTDSGLAQGIPAGEARCRHLPFAECHQGHVLGEEQEVSGMEGQDIKCLKELEEENHRLKQMYAELAMDSKMLKDVLSKKFTYSLDKKTGDKKALNFDLSPVVERKRFELSIPFRGIHTFQACSFNHSDTSLVEDKN